MGEYSVARVVIDSPLLSLDKPFDFGIPEQLRDQVQIGSLVRVTLGRSVKQHDAYVVELAKESEFKLRDIVAVNGAMRLLPANIYRLCRALADRSVCGIGDLLKVAVPSRMVRSEAAFSEASWAADAALSKQGGKRTTELAFDWLNATTSAVSRTIARGESAIVITPDYRDQTALVSALEAQEISYIDYSASLAKSARYQAFLQAQTTGSHVVIGNRSAIYAPLQNLGLILVKDEWDDSLTEQTAPYLATRDAALLRQQQEGCDLHFVSASRSTDIQRLIEIGYLDDISVKAPAPKVSFDADNSRNSGLAYAAIREGLNQGPVLVQVANRGVAKTCYCRDCSTRAICRSCGGPLWVDATSIPRCRWCNLQNLDFTCPECQSHSLRQGLGGVTRSVAEFGKSFPGVKVVESSYDKPVLSIKPGKALVVATPGAEPIVEGGYAAVVILDAGASLHLDSLRASERAVARWANAIALLAKSGRAVIAGVPGSLGQKLALWQLEKIAQDELEDRRAHSFPPNLRMASIQGELEVARKVVAHLQQHMPSVQVLGPIAIKNGPKLENRFVLKFAYTDGAQLALELRAAILMEASAPQTSATGRNSRAVRVRMDDTEVI